MIPFKLPLLPLLMHYRMPSSWQRLKFTNIQPGSTAYCVTVSLESNLYTVMSDKTVLLGAIAGDEGDVAEFEVYLSSPDAGNLHATIEWFAAQGCDSEAQILTATREYNISPQTWTIGVDVYPSCIVEEDVVISIIDSEGVAITVPHIVAGGDAIGRPSSLPRNRERILLRHNSFVYSPAAMCAHIAIARSLK